jgi:hypothetical protein
MRVVNLFGGPGSGKSTTAASLFVWLKNKGLRAELIGEEAKDQIYWGSRDQLSNQLFIAAMQYARIKNLERAGCEIAIADSPLTMSPLYAKNMHYFQELNTLITKVNLEFHNVNVFVTRTKKFDPFGRTQKDVEEAKVIDEIVRSAFKFDITITGDIEGQKVLNEWVGKLVVQ